MIDNFDRWGHLDVKFFDEIAIIISHFPRTLESLKYSGCSIMYITPSMSVNRVKKFMANADWAYANKGRSATAITLPLVPGDSHEETLDAARIHENPGSARSPRNIKHTQVEKPTLPASQLRRLNIIGSNSSSMRRKISIAYIIDRYGVSLEMLGLYFMDIGNIELCSVLRQSVRLTHLQLQSCERLRLEDIFDFLTVPHDASEIMCPALQRLHLASRSYTSESVQPFVDMVVSRWRYMRIKGLNFSLIERVDGLRSSLTPGQMQELERCISEGLDYTMHHEGVRLGIGGARP